MKRATALLSSFLILSGLLLGSCPVRAQENIRQEALHLAKLLVGGNYDELISRTSTLLDQWGRPDQGLLYLRGFSELRIAWFGAAERDLVPLGEYRLSPQWPTASELTRKIEQLRKICPENSKEIKANGKVAFHVYYDTDDDWSQAIIKLLPEALRIGKTLFGVQAYETAVFIFSTRQRLDNFIHTLGALSHPDSWSWAMGNTGILYFSKTNGRGEEPGKDSGSDYFRGTVVHEYTHSLVHRAAGHLHLPIWMDEGIAMYSASKMTSSMQSANDQAIRKCVANSALASLKDLDTSESFYGLEEKMVSAERNTGQPYTGPDVYEQAFSMIRYLLPKDSERDFSRFIDQYCDCGDIETAFRTTFHQSMENFYKAWKRHVTRASGATTPSNTDSTDGTTASGQP